MTALDPKAAAVVDAENPWPGLLSFEESNEHFFRGRDREKYELLRLVLRERAAILYGISGLGKTSLVQAGLFPLARRNSLLPIVVRFDFLPGAPDLVEQVRRAVLAVARPGVEVPAVRAGESLWEYFHRKSNEFWTNRLVTPLLFFDQFEELFTKRAHIEPVLEVLADFAAGSPPETVRRGMDANPELTGEFHFDHHPYRILFGIREDYFASMEPLFQKVRGLELHRFQLLPMNGRAALEVVDQAPGLVTSAVAERIVRVAAAAENSVHPPEEWQVEPALLSLLCRELNERRKRENLAQITDDLLVGSRDRIFSDFYEQSINNLSPAVREFVEEKLLTDSGHRNSEPIDNLRRYGLTEADLAPLITSRLLHIGQWGETRRVEISHDRLTGVVRVSRDRRRERIAREQAEQARIEAEARAVKAREALRKTVFTNILLMVLAASSLVVGSFAFYQLHVVKMERDKTLFQQKRADEESGRRQATEKVLSQTKLNALEREIRAQVVQDEITKSRIAEIERARGLNLSERGWGVIFASGLDKGVRAALKPLLDRRKQQAGDRYSEFNIQPDETAGKMIGRYKKAASAGDRAIPQYLLLVGNPEQISFNVQYELGTQYATGRLSFEKTRDYGAYAASVVRAEDEAPRQKLRAFVFATRIASNAANRILHDGLVAQFRDSFFNNPSAWSQYDWSMRVTKPEEAVRERFLRELAPRAPDLIFTATPTIQYNKNSTLLQKDETAALVDGRYEGGPVTREVLITPANIPPSADLTGSVVFCFGSYGAGMSRYDEFGTLSDGQPRVQSDEAFVSRLPLRLLASAKGGALAVIGHVDNNWVSSIRGDQGWEPEAFFGFFRRVMDGETVGLAMEPFRARQARLTSAALEFMGAPAAPAAGDSPDTNSSLKSRAALIAAKDSRNYVILGDPAAAINIKPLVTDPKPAK